VGGDENGELPRRLRDVLLQRVARLDADTQSLLRLAAAAGRDVGYALLHALTALPERGLRESLRRAVEHGVLVTDQASASFRFRHALLAEAVYTTLLPGEREEVHARLADELARSAAASPAELAPHWAAAGRSAEALGASVDAARRAGAVFGLAEAHAHLERALALWPAVPDAAELAGLDLAGLCAWAAELASHVGAAPRALELARRAIDLVGGDDPHRTALLHVSLGEYLLETGSDDAALAAVERAVKLAPAETAFPGARVRGGVARGRSDGGLALCGVAADRRAGARTGQGGRRPRGRGAGDHRARRRPRLPRPRRGGYRPLSSSPGAR
jgi:predicted ATPase